MKSDTLSNARNRPQLLALLLALLLVLVFALVWGYRAIARQSLDELTIQSRNHLTLFVSNLKAVLDQYEHLPALIATNRYLIDALQNPDSPRLIDANRYLKSVAVTSGASDVYLMDRAGLTVAASNWDLKRSFIGANFSFRPYFQQALNGLDGRYFALGATSLKRGYYFSYPVSKDQRIMGVVVLKIDLADIESEWTTQGNHFLVTDTDGIVFLSTHPEWTYRSLQPISENRMNQIHLARRYADKTIRPLSPKTLQILENGVTQVVFPGEKNSTPQHFLHLSRSMPDAGWTVHLMVNTHTIHSTRWLRTSLAGFGVLTLLLLIGLYLTNRHRRLALQESTELLEHRVQQRTRQLQSEVEERKKAEQSLRDTQSELIQAAKLAGLGQMSAGISHELNQPLTAIRNYSENAVHLLERNQPEAVGENLREIGEITKHMAAIIAQLRGFSRKSKGERNLVSLTPTLSQALGMFEREQREQHIEVISCIDPGLTTITDPVLFNQVLVNVISNAIHAMVDQPRRCLTINARRMGGWVCVQIGDSGAGIAEELIDNLFDPFFTTKEVGMGLGLGLSISYRIMESLGGRIDASNSSRGGALFELYLPDEQV